MYFVAKPNEEAKAFIQAAGLTDETQCRAVSTLVIDLKNYGLWDKMRVIYPFVGQPGVSSSFQYNLKDPNTFRGTFSGGWNFTSTGVIPDGFSAYMDTTCAPNQMSQNSIHLSVYNRTEANSGIEMGSRTNPSNCQIVSRLGDLNYSFINQPGGSSFSQTVSTGFIIAQRTNSTQRIYFRNNIKTTTNDASAAPNSISFYICARNVNGTSVDNYDSREKSFASIGDGLTDTEAANLYTAVQRFQTTLGRQV
jgi:hypothetical protein